MLRFLKSFLCYNAPIKFLKGLLMDTSVAQTLDHLQDKKITKPKKQIPKQEVIEEVIEEEVVAPKKRAPRKTTPKKDK